MWNQFCLLLPSSVQVKLHLGQFKITSLDDPSWSIYFSHHLKFLLWMNCPAPFQTLLPCIIQVTEISSQWPCPRKQAITYLVLAAVGIKEGIANLNSPGSPSWLTAGSELYLPEARCDLCSDCTAPFVWARTGCGWREAGLAHCPAPGAQPARHRVMLSVPEQSCFNLPALLLPPWGVCGTSVSQRAGLVLHPRLGACRTLQEVSWGKVSWAWSVRRGKIRRVCRARSPPLAMLLEEMHKVTAASPFSPWCLNSALLFLYAPPVASSASCEGGLQENAAFAILSGLGRVLGGSGQPTSDIRY